MYINPYYWVDEFIPYMEIMGVDRPDRTEDQLPQPSFFGEAAMNTEHICTMAVYPGQATSWIYSPGCNRGKTTGFLVGNCLLKSCSPDGDWQPGCGVDPSNKQYIYIYM